MEGLFRKINVGSFNENVFTTLNKEGALLTAGKPDHFNTMTISWGTFGMLWNKPVLFVFVRPQRYTSEFMTSNHYFTVSLLRQEYKDIIDYCGSHSGRDSDKIKATGLVPHPTDLGNVIYEQIRWAFECKKIYDDKIKPESFLDPSIIQTTYQKSDFHRMFIGEIVNCYKPF
jgi:flavin reductase (DIM6/NTAB) family NADH-FMN oxidoreductase RutF